MTTFDEVWGAASNLSATDRLRLIDALWGTVEPETWPTPSEQWIAESKRRSHDLDEGRMQASEWSEVKSRARRKAGLDD